MAMRFLLAGFVSGAVWGFGLAGFWFMNPYIALMVFLGGTICLWTAHLAAYDRDSVDSRLSRTEDEG